MSEQNKTLVRRWFEQVWNKGRAESIDEVHSSATATHGGGGLGFAATGKRVSFSGMTLIRVEGKKLIEGWNSFDQLGLLQQLGVASLP